MEQVGLSPKVIASAITAAVAPIVVAFLAKWLGADVDVETVAGIIGPIALGLVTLAVGYWFGPGVVVPKDYGGCPPIDNEEVPYPDEPGKPSADPTDGPGLERA